MTSVGDKIAIARTQRRPTLSQQELAELTGVSRFKISDFETGRIKNPRLVDITAIANALHVPVEWFFDGQPGHPPVREESNVQIVHDPQLVAGFAITAAIPSYRSAAAGAEGDEPWFEPEEPVEIPTAFLVGGASRIDRHSMVRVSGRSLEPRIPSGSNVVIYLDPTLKARTIVLAESPDRRLWLKVLRPGPAGRFELHSLNDAGARFDDLSGWKIHGYAVAVLHDDAEPGPNVEWYAGRPLRA